MTNSHIIGCLLGTAVGDALGLPYEGVSRRRAARLLGPPDRHRFLLRRGMVSDDTEHTCMVAQSLIATGDDPELFAREFARRLRWWFLSLPPGIGRATLRASLKLCLGLSPSSSGVFSAGNGPAMRAAILGAAVNNMDRMVQCVRVSTRITHTDPKAEFGAVAVALAAFLARHESNVSPSAFVDRLAEVVGPDGTELIELLRPACSSVAAGQSTREFTEEIGLKDGVSGYIYHTVPVVIHAWLLNQCDFRSAVTSVVECGGDTDTTAAIVGGIVGTAVGKSGIPAEWLNSLCEWPRTVGWMERLGQQLHRCSSEGEQDIPVRLNVPTVLLRNLFFLVVVFGHGFRRLLPPY